MRMQHFIIPERLPGLNEVLDARRAVFKGKTKARFDRYSKLKEEVEQRIAIWARAARLVPVTGKVHQTIAFFEAGRRDPDNALIGAKFIGDTLVRLDLLPDDSWKELLGLTVHVSKSATDGVFIALASVPVPFADCVRMFEGRKQNERREDRKEAFDDSIGPFGDWKVSARARKT